MIEIKKSQKGSVQTVGLLCLLLGVVGIVVVVAMNPGILGTLSAPSTTTKAPRSLQEIIPPGHRTLTISGREIDGSVIWITPGTVIDVFGSRKGSYRQIASGILVLSVNGQLVMKEPPAELTSLTVAVTISDLEKIMLAKTEGTLSFSIAGGQ